MSIVTQSAGVFLGSLRKEHRRLPKTALEVFESIKVFFANGRSCIYYKTEP